ncbi:hypothetical protein HanIR_Chr02g0098151 [Helianthus annuus]|nr:hypothetical protein HanIR_Chr02g0098151 [Helianthus annuus]
MEEGTSNKVKTQYTREAFYHGEIEENTRLYVGMKGYQLLLQYARKLSIKLTYGFMLVNVIIRSLLYCF